MKHIAARWIVVALLFAGVAGAVPASGADAQQSVIATLTLPYDTILPGVPFDLVVTLKNVSNKRVTVGLGTRLFVRDSEGRVLLTGLKRPPHEDQRNRGGLQPFEYGYVVLGPGESVERVLDWQYSVPSWAQYAEISGPGTYEIALYLERSYLAYEDFVNYVGVVRTNTVKLHRVVALGEDEALWKRMQASAGGQWADMHFISTKEGLALAEEIVRLHPASGYYPYALIMSKLTKNRSKEDFPPLVEAAGRFKDSPAYAHLLKAAGNVAMSVAGVAASFTKDRATAEEYFRHAQTYYDAALKTSNRAIRADTEDRLHMLRRDTARHQLNRE